MDQTAGNIMLEGLQLDILDEPLLFSEPPEDLVTRGVQEVYLRDFVPGWLEEDVIGKLTLPIPPSHFSRMFSSQTPREEEAHHRPVSLQQGVEKTRFPHGGPLFDCKDNFSRSLGGEARPKGCVFPHPPLPKVLEILPFCPRQREGKRDLLFQGPSFRPLIGSLGLHQGNEGHKESSKTSGHPTDVLPGRFSNTGPILRGGSGPYFKDYRSPSETGFPDKLGKVLQGASEIPGIPRHHHQLGGYDLFSSRRKGKEDPVFLQGGSRGLEAFKAGVREARRLFQLRSSIPEIGKTIPETNCVVDESQHFGFSKGSFRPSRQRPQGSSTALDESGVSKVSCPDTASVFFQNPHDRRIIRCLGRSPSPSFGERSLASRMGGHVYELEGVKGSSPVPNEVSRPVEGALCQNLFRQHDGSSLHKKGGVSSIPGSLGSFEGPSPVRTFQRHHTSSSSPEREAQCSGGQGFQAWPDQHGMVIGSQFLQHDLQGLGSSPGGSFCHQGKCSTSSFRLSVSRPLGSGMRCSQRQPGLESIEINLPVSSFSAYRRGSVEAEGLQGFRLLGDALLANGSLVRALREEVSFQDPPPERGLLVPEVFRNHTLPQVPFLFQPSRLETIRAAIIKEGLNDYSVRVLCRCHKVSTINQYQGVWSKFLLYLASLRIRHHEVKINHVINFFSFYSESNNLAYKTLAVYKNALRLPLLFSLGLNLDCPLVVHYMLGLHAIKPPPSQRVMPPWDLSDLLLFLQSGEFHPLETCSFLRLTQKTLALILLASGRRIHEVTALSRDFRRSGNKVVLFWPRGFRAKNYRVGHYPEDPSIRGMTHFFAGPRDLRNCPVESWKIYVNRRSLVTNPSDDSNFWTLSYKALFTVFKSLISDSRKFVRESTKIKMVPHQTKKFAVSYCRKYFSDAEKRKLHQITGNKVFSTLSRYYVGSVPRLRVAVSLPLGTVPPRVRQ